MLTVVVAAAARRRLQQGDEHQDDDGDEGQRDEDVLVDGEQAHLPHALAAPVNGDRCREEGDSIASVCVYWLRCGSKARVEVSLL